MRPASLAWQTHKHVASSLLFDVTAADFFGIEMKEVALSGKFYQLLLEVFVRQQHSPLLTHENGRRDRSPLLMDHRVCNGQRTAPIHSHYTVNQGTATRLPSIFDDVECHIKVLHYVIWIILRIKLYIPANCVTIELSWSAAVSTAKINTFLLRLSSD